MRNLIAALPLLALTACGGASGPQTVGTIASAGSTPTPSTFLAVTEARTFDALGSFHKLDVEEATGAVLYAGNAATVRAPSGQITYSPRDGIFTLNFVDKKAGIAESDLRFQDPAHRTDFLNYATPQWGVPDIAGYNYIQSLGGTASKDRADTMTFFYQRPGTVTSYVSLAGWVRNAFDLPTSPNLATSSSSYERGAMVFGDPTARSGVPTSGTASYAGEFLASMVGNLTKDSPNPNPNYFQWITGTSALSIDFSKATVALTLTGTVNPATMKGAIITDSQLSFVTGSTFTANGTAKIDLINAGGFTGAFTEAYFQAPGDPTKIPVNFQGINPANSVAGASSIDGTFYGPNGSEVGGDWRIVGGTPNQRVDILGAFTGKKN